MLSYAAMHHVFLTRYGVYLLAFDMREILTNTDQAISDLKFWLNSVELHAPDAPVVLVVCEFVLFYCLHFVSYMQYVLFREPLVII